jgi:hypothetical protein
MRINRCIPLGVLGTCIAALLLTGCASTLQYPPFPDQAKRLEDPAKARIYVMRGASAFNEGAPAVVYGFDWTATGPTLDPSQKFVMPLFGVLPDNYDKNKEIRRIGEVGPHSYICWETPPHVMTIQRVQGDANSIYTIDVQPGNVYYLRARIRPGWVENKTVLEQLPEDQGLKLLKECKPPNSYRK